MFVISCLLLLLRLAGGALRVVGAAGGPLRVLALLRLQQETCGVPAFAGMFKKWAQPLGALNFRGSCLCLKAATAPGFEPLHLETARIECMRTDRVKQLTGDPT